MQRNIVWFTMHVFECIIPGALLRAALAASCLRGALPPVLLRAVCLVRAIVREKRRGEERRGE